MSCWTCAICWRRRTRTKFEAELRLRLARIDDDDGVFNRLREFKAAQCAAYRRHRVAR